MGRVDYEPHALEALRYWHMAGGPPAPIHPSLKGYTNRRTAHLIKLCVLISAASAARVMTLEHYQRALFIMNQTERVMGDVFLDMKKGGDAKVMDQAWFFTYTEFNRTDLPSRSGLVTFVSERTPSHNIEKLIDTMVAINFIERHGDVLTGVTYTPKTRGAS